MSHLSNVAQNKRRRNNWCVLTTVDRVDNHTFYPFHLVTPDNGLPIEKMQLGLQLVRRVNFWKDVCVNISPIMDQMARMFFRLQNNGKFRNGSRLG